MISSLARRAALRAASTHNVMAALSRVRKQISPSALSMVLTRRGLATKTTDAPTEGTDASPTTEPKAGPDSDIPSIFDQATGLERAEIEYPDIFKHNEVLRGPFGTEDNPVKIRSHYDNRIVGCTGRPSPDDHDIVWLQVEKGEKACCPECGQYFELDPL